jgi:hypothetical protein
MTAEAVTTADAAPGVRVREAAPQLGLAERTVRRACARRIIPAKKRGRLWFISPAYLASQNAWPSEEGTAA